MYEVVLTLDEMIDLRAQAAKVELRQMVVAAMRAIDQSLGFAPAYTNRSIAQRKRFARMRAYKEPQ